ncbi:MAG: hypothetical protein L0241_03715 [Planctomycetia bacterium]|nr:hypothetical protein [Planctomycetia bacterium]
MATVQEKPMKVMSTRHAERDPQVYHPLDRLRGIIRRYVVIEGMLSIALFLAVWFALGLLFDFGLFKTLGWDWVRDGAWTVRFLALVIAIGLLVSILVFRIVRRLTTEFSYPALALVLERKFPKVLGDRLITAVEMADVEAMGKFGYSKEMIRATIAEARERVGKVPVNEVFNWKRLWVMGFITIGVLVGTLVVSFASFAIATKSADMHRFGWRLAHVSGIFLERNVALMDTPWPRRAHVELIGFPESGELTIGRGEKAPLTARAYRWVIADRNSPEGWRPMFWSDVTEEFVGRRVPTIPFDALAVGGDTTPLPTEASHWTVDTLEYLVFEREDAAPDKNIVAMRAELKKKMNTKWENGQPVRSDKGEVVSTNDYEELQEVFKALNEKAEQPSMGRTLRRLDLTEWVLLVDKEGNPVRDENGKKIYEERPLEVKYKFSGRRGRELDGALTAGKYNVYTGVIETQDLTEDGDFVLKAADFETTPRNIRLIPPPTLRKLRRTQFEPAYLHHVAPQGEGDLWLQGKMQELAPRDVSLTGERSVFIVPSGTELILTAEADDPENDPLIWAHAKPVTGKFPGAKRDAQGRLLADPVNLPITGNGAGFSVEFRGADRLTDDVEFQLVFANRYNVTATRTVRIQVAQDQPPTVEVGVDVIRKVGTHYLVTPSARIPFDPASSIRDDHGLSKLEYIFSYRSEDSDYVRALRVSYAMRSFIDTPGPGPMFIPGLVFPIRHYDNLRILDKGDDKLSAAVGISEFSNQYGRLRRETSDHLLKLLKTPLGEEIAPVTVNRVDLKNPDRDYFDLKELNDRGIIKILAPSEGVQSIFRMELNIQATDNNVDNETGPRVSKNATPIFLRIVPESDLLLEISKEEEQFGNRVEEALNRVIAARRKFEFVVTTNGYQDLSPTNVQSVKVKLTDAIQDVEKARDIVQGVVRDYRRIYRECQINRVTDTTTARYGKMGNWMDRILGENPTLINDKEAEEMAEGAWVTKTTFPKTQKMLDSVQGELVSDPPRWAELVLVSDTQNQLFLLESDLEKIRKQIGESGNKEKLKQQLLTLLANQKRVKEQIDKMYEDYLIRLSGKEPIIGAVGAQFLAKGETKKIRHNIEWLQYPSDNLTIKVTASDPSVVVPGEMKLDYEKNDVFFEYEIKAGNKEGDFKITVTPAVGKPVEVLVTVK